jgi:glycosyltransferase involved in cell wall biosynthesis
MTGAVSVVVPTYNGREFLARALGSVFSQTVRPCEIVVVDDASTDDTVALARSIAANAPVRVAVVALARNSGGPARPINTGVGHATGDLVAVLEQDDVMLPRRLEAQVACLEAAPGVGLAFGRCVYVNPREGPPRETETVTHRLAAQALGPGLYRIGSYAAYSGLVAGMFALTWSALLFPRRVWQQVGGVDESIATASDYAFLERVAREFDLGFVDEAVTEWHIRTDSLYRTAVSLRRGVDRLRVLCSFDAARLDRATRARLRRAIREAALGAAFLARERGDVRSALAHYSTAVRRGCSGVRAPIGVLKLFPHRLLRGVRGR